MKLITLLKVCTVVLLTAVLMLTYVCISQRRQINSLLNASIDPNTPSDSDESELPTYDGKTDADNSKKADEPEKVKSDITAFLEAYFNIDYDRGFDPNEQTRQLLTMVTENGANNLALAEHGTEGYELDDYSYMSRIDIKNLYCDFFDETTVNVFVRAEQIIRFESNPQSTSPLLISIDSEYDRESDMWKVDSLQQYNVRW